MAKAKMVQLVNGVLQAPVVNTVGAPPKFQNAEEEIAFWRAKAQAAEARASAPKALSIKVGQKGTVAVYGLNRGFPVALYPSQWKRLAEFMPQVDKFITDGLGRQFNVDVKAEDGTVIGQKVVTLSLEKLEQ